MSNNPTFKPGTINATLEALSALHSNPRVIEHDLDDPSKLVTKLVDLAVERRDKFGEYERYRLLIDAADALEVMGVEIAEAKEALTLLKLQVRDLSDQIASIYSVVETRPATHLEPAEHKGVRATNDENDGWEDY